MPRLRIAVRSAAEPVALSISAAMALSFSGFMFMSAPTVFMASSPKISLMMRPLSTAPIFAVARCSWLMRSRNGRMLPWASLTWILRSLMYFAASFEGAARRVMRAVRPVPAMDPLMPTAPSDATIATVSLNVRPNCFATGAA
ncbi:hypothetical protein D3C72_718210 [compost metagenome]